MIEMNSSLIKEMFLSNDRVLLYKSMGRAEYNEKIRREKPKIEKLLQENYGIQSIC